MEQLSQWKSRERKIHLRCLIWQSTGLKTGLMGPVAALGDSFDWGIIGTLMKIAAATLAAAGNPLALVVLLLFVGYCIGELILTTNMTYKKGKRIY